jgi:alkyl hydroperoxide reductase subunit F
MRGLLEDIASVSDKVSLLENGNDARRPSFTVGKVGEPARIALRRPAHGPRVHLADPGPAASQRLRAQDQRRAGRADQVADRATFRFETYISLSCHNCPDVVQALNTMAALNPERAARDDRRRPEPGRGRTRQIMAVPSVWLNGEPFDDGRMSMEEILAKVDTGAGAREAAKLAEKAPFDVLVVGGGPAGAAAAVYAARKGIRTGVLAERFGGQVMDTLAIENLISVPHTDGPKLGRALEEHVKEYEVDIMNLQRAEALIPGEAGGFHEVRLANGAVMKAKAVILATGARWRELNVPGEQEYRGKGVAYCPHCDGPLFKGKHVAVVGGGNSGVEAAIDLAGIVGHVTLLEFGDALRADAVLQNKLYSLPNVTVIKSAQTTEVTGAGGKVNGLTYTDRTHRPEPAHRPGRRVRADRPAAQHRLAEGRGEPVPLRRDRSGRPGPDQRARRVRRRRLHHRALQADHHRHGRGRQGQPGGVRLPDPQFVAGLIPVLPTGDLPVASWCNGFSCSGVAAHKKSP